MFYISFYSTSYFVCSSRSSLTPWFYIVIYNCYNYLSYFFKNSFFRIFKLYILSSSRSSSYSYSLLFSLYNYVQEDCHAFLTSWLDKRGNYTAELIFVFVSLSYFWQSPFLPWSLFSIFHLHRFKKLPFLLVSENLYHTQMSCRCMHYTCILEQSLQSIENLAIEAPKMLVV